MKPSLSNELLTLGAILNQHIPREELRAILSSPLDWEAILTDSAQLSIAPFLYSHLKNLNLLEAVPKTFRDACRGGLFWLQAENMKRFVRVQSVLESFHTQHIPVIVLKGAALAELVYPSLGCRAMGDVDLLVHKQDLDKAEGILEELGYRELEQELCPQWYKDFHHHRAPRISQDGNLIIELHHHIIPLNDPVHIPISEFWERALPTHIAGRPCLVFSPEDLLIHLSHHLSASNHFIGQLRGLCDISQVVNRYSQNIDWNQLIKTGIYYEIQKHLYYSLWLAKHHTGTEIPGQVFQQLKNSFTGGKAQDWVFKFLIQQAVFIHDSFQHPVYVWFLQDICREWLSHPKSKIRLSIFYQRAIHRFRKYSVSHDQIYSQQSGHSLILIYLRYAWHLLKKACGAKVAVKLP